jgi:hypothetical protein
MKNTYRELPVHFDDLHLTFPSSSKKNIMMAYVKRLASPERIETIGLSKEYLDVVVEWVKSRVKEFKKQFDPLELKQKLPERLTKMPANEREDFTWGVHLYFRAISHFDEIKSALTDILGVLNYFIKKEGYDATQLKCVRFIQSPSAMAKGFTWAWFYQISESIVGALEFCNVKHLNMSQIEDKLFETFSAVSGVIGTDYTSMEKQVDKFANRDIIEPIYAASGIIGEKNN